MPVRAIRFPLAGQVSFVDTFGACRDGCTRCHKGTDIFAPKLRHILAAADGYVTYLRTDASGTAGNGVGITDAAGWRYLYLHMNNDTPGTDDGRNPARWRFIPGLRVGTKVYAGQSLGYLGDSGNAESTPSHLHFEIRTPEGVDISPYPSLLRASRDRPVPRAFRYDIVRSGGPDDHVPFGPPATNAVLGCDWDGDGDDTIGVRRGDVNHVRNTLLSGGSRGFRAGLRGDWASTGEWTTTDRQGSDSVNLWRRYPR